MSDERWSDEQIARWIDSQEWYQTIRVRDGLCTPGTTASLDRLDLLDLKDLSGKSVLDVGCNSGLYAFECKRLGAARVVGIEPQERRLQQARTLARIMDLDVELLDLDLQSASRLGRFDIVLCISVVTEIADLIGSLSTLKRLTGERLYLELSVLDRPSGPTGLLSRIARGRAFGWVARAPVARLRRTKSGWALAPNVRFLEELFGDEFTITDLGPSVRYRLLRLDRRSNP